MAAESDTRIRDQLLGWFVLGVLGTLAFGVIFSWFNPAPEKARVEVRDIDSGCIYRFTVDFDQLQPVCEGSPP